MGILKKVYSTVAEIIFEILRYFCVIFVWGVVYCLIS